MILRLAIRNLTRNRWRTVLTVAGVAVAVALLVWTLAYMEGFSAELVRGATSVDLGQVGISKNEYVEKPQIRHHFVLEDAALTGIREVPGVEGVAPRVRAFGLVGNEDRSIISRLVGVDPEAEAQTTVASSGLVAGRWLGTPPEYPAPREVVVGRNFADQLKVDIGAELVVFFEASDGSLGNDLLKVVGIVKTQNAVVDRQTLYMHIADLQYAAAMEGKIHEVAIKVADVRQAEATAALVSAKLKEIGHHEGLAVRSWQQQLPEISQMLSVMEKSDIFMYFVVYLIVAFGLFNAQRMSALERSREFGVILAIGVSPTQLFMTVIFETVVVTFLGAFLGVILGGLVSLYHEAYGMDVSSFMPEGSTSSFDMMGVSFSERLKFVVTPRVLIRPVLFILPVAFLCGLWPALQAARLNITAAISGRT